MDPCQAVALVQAVDAFLNTVIWLPLAWGGVRLLGAVLW